MPDRAGQVDDDDPLNDDTPDDVLWTRVNVSEAVPGVMYPVTWSFYGELVETGARRGFHQLGVLPRAGVAYPAAVGERLFGVFAGRYATNVGVVRTQFSALPGVSGDDVERDMLGSIREGVDDESPGFRLPAIALRMPPRLLRAGRNARRCRDGYGRWWRSRTGRCGLTGPGTPTEALAEAADRFTDALRLQGHGRLIYSGTTSALMDLAARAGRPELFPTLLAGVGEIEETLVADDLWRLAHDRLDLDTFLARHGYHGPTVGEIAARSWREDPAPVLRLLGPLRDTPPPSTRRAGLPERRRAAAAEVLAALPRRDRPVARLVLRVAPASAVALQRTKAAFLMSLDVARAAIREIGAELVGSGRLDDPGQAFHFFLPELLDPGSGDLKEAAQRRQAARERYQALEVPETWTGPVPTTRPAPTGPGAARLTGLGVAAGTATGRARVVLDPGDPDADLDPGDVLVCHTTDPSWVALMTLAGALVIDVGGPASHGAVVARELGIPCVIGTHTGTRDVPDGARLRVDGAAGTVDVLPA
jgi:pyruvate,water dikinase